MTEKNTKILELIQKNISMKEICRILNISEKQLYLRIKQIIYYGYNISFNYDYDSNIHYKLENEQLTPKSNVKIRMSNKDNVFRCIVISDNHIGNNLDDLTLLKRVYEYAAKNNIKIILNCGDLIEGVHSSDKTYIDSTQEQIEYLIKKYPYDKSIINYMILGNHDHHSLYYDKIDFAKRIKNYRYDMVVIGYGKGIVNIKQDSLSMEHRLSVVENPQVFDKSIVSLVGHGHLMKIKTNDKLNICIPTLSNVSPDKTREVLPGFVDLSINFENDRFECVNAKYMALGDKIVDASEYNFKIKKLFKK